VALLFLIVTPGHVNAQKITVKIFNTSDYQIKEVYLTQSENEQWGKNLLGKKVLKFEKDLDVSLNVKGDALWNLLIVDQEGNVVSSNGLALFDKCVLEIYNNEGVYEFYVFDPNEAEHDSDEEG